MDERPAIYREHDNSFDYYSRRSFDHKVHVRGNLFHNKQRAFKAV